MGIEALRGPDEVNYYTLINRQKLGGRLYGKDFSDSFVRERKGTDFLFKLAEETGFVLLPGQGFEVVDASARVSMANLTEADYQKIGKFTRKVLDEFDQEFQNQKK